MNRLFGIFGRTNAKMTNVILLCNSILCFYEQICLFQYKMFVYRAPELFTGEELEAVL